MLFFLDIMHHHMLILYSFLRRSSLTWSFHQASGLRAIRHPQGMIRSTTTSISPRTTWPRSTSSRLRPQRVTVKTAGQRERTVPFSLVLTRRAKPLRDPDGKHSPWETVAVVALLTGRNLNGMHLVSKWTQRYNMLNDKECNVCVISGDGHSSKGEDLHVKVLEEQQAELKRKVC